jgi:MFS family permease
VIGPVIAGYLVAARGWRWVFWFLAIVSGGFTLISLAFLREPYPPVLLERKTQRSRKARNNPGLRSKLDKSLTPGQLFARSIIRPTKILFLSPIVLLLSIYMGIVYGYQYLMFSTFSAVFEQQYGFSTQSIGLSFLGIGIGSLIGLFAVGAVSDRIVKARAKPSKKNPEGKMQPEFRLPPLVAGAFFIPAGLFMYGWTAQYKEPWIAPEIGTALVGIGNMAVFMVVVTYLVDAFTIYAASALAANTVVRSIMGALLPLAGQKMYASLGVGWGNSLLGFIAVACIPVPWALMKYGERLRTSFDSSRL